MTSGRGKSASGRVKCPIEQEKLPWGGVKAPIISKKRLREGVKLPRGQEKWLREGVNEPIGTKKSPEGRVKPTSGSMLPRVFGIYYKIYLLLFSSSFQNT